MGLRRSAFLRKTRRALALAVVVPLAVVVAPAVSGLPAPTAAVPAGFADTVAISGLTSPTAAAFAPDGRVFVAEKSGLIKVFDCLADTTPTCSPTCARRSTTSGTAACSAWRSTRSSRPARTSTSSTPTTPRSAGRRRAGDSRASTDPARPRPGATDHGCVVTGRVSPADHGPAGNAGQRDSCWSTTGASSTPATPSATWPSAPTARCTPAAATAPASTSPTTARSGNPCGDPPRRPATQPDAADRRGRRAALAGPRAPPGDPVLLDGDADPHRPRHRRRRCPATRSRAAPTPTPGASSPTGSRNPFRFAFRPGTSEIWVGDVGWGTWEEINRVANADRRRRRQLRLAVLRGHRPAGRLRRREPRPAANRSTPPAGPTAPLLHLQPQREGRGRASRARPAARRSSGIAFYAGGNYPAAYSGALFFADYSRGCIWVMQTADGQPEPGTLVPLRDRRQRPGADLEIGPGGDLFYVDLDGGELRRVSYPAAPTGRRSRSATASPPAGRRR